MADPGFAKGGTMASVRSVSLNGGLGAEPLVGVRGRSPSEADSFLACDSMLRALYAIARPSVRPSVCPSVYHTGGSVKNS